MKKETTFLIFGFLGILFLTFLFISKSNEKHSVRFVNDQLKVHFIDVGQGDATLLKGPDFTILVDAGRHDRNDVISYLTQQNIKEIDLLIGTHPHADHIGQFPDILRNFTVDEVWLSGDLHTILTFEHTINAIIETGVKYHEPIANEKFNFGSLSLEVLHPTKLTGDLNNGSIAIRAIYHDIIFIFTGDAEYLAELEIVRNGQNLKSHILQVGHHGSNSSSTSDFLRLVSPDVAVYSAGKGNEYGHPHSEVIDRMNNLNIDVFGTDVNGTVIVTTDGKEYYIKLEKRRDESILFTE